MDTKFFAGTRVTSEIKASLLHGTESELMKISHEGKEYLGLYMEKSSPTLQEIRQFLDHLNYDFHQSFPHLQPQWVVFPQLFLG